MQAARKPAVRPDANWPQFRGPGARGVAEGAPTPQSWNVDEKRNVLWKTPLAGLGHSSPIVWGDRVFVAAALSPKNNDLKVGLYGDIEPVLDDSEHEWRVYCLDKRSGKVLWMKVAHKGVPKVRRHPKATHASSTLATDGTNLVAFFGSEGLYNFDLNGNLRWKKDFGLLDSGYYQAPEAQWGFASSPILDRGRIYVQCDVQKGSFVAALDAASGRQIWKAGRDDVPTWSTPTLWRVGERPQLVVNGWKHIGGYDAGTGLELWRLTGGGDIPVPTPVPGPDLIFITNAHGRQSPIYAIKPGATGNITLPDGADSSRYIAWSTAREGAYMQTPVVYGDLLYVCRDNGVLSCYEARTGKRVYNERLGTGRTGFTASAVASGGKLYFTSEEGDTYVVRAGPTFQLLATNSLGESCMATPALSDGVIYFHTQSSLVAIGPKRS